MVNMKFEANVKTKFSWIIPILIGFSKNVANDKSTNYSLHITPFIEITFNKLGT